MPLIRNAVWIGAHRDNYSPGRSYWGFTVPIEFVVYHTMAGTLAGTDAWFNAGKAARAGVPPSSAHFGVGLKLFGLDTVVHQYVRIADTAYHSVWNRGTIERPKPAMIPVNLYSVGIENEDNQIRNRIWTPEMYEANAWITAFVGRRAGWKSIEKWRLVRHSEIDTVNRRDCPGSGVDMGRLLAECQKEFERLAA